MSRAQTLSKLAQGLVYDGTSNLTVGSITVGRGAGAVSTNTAVGTSALAANTTGAFNTASGYLALRDTTTGTHNTAAGIQALVYNSTGGSNTAFGSQALQNNTTANANTAVGYQSLYSNTTASNNVAVGYQAGYSNTTGIFNINIGAKTGYSNTASSGNTFIGHNAGYSFNSAGSVTNTAGNIAIGMEAGYSLTTGAANVLIGSNNSSFTNPAGQQLTSGNVNTFIGAGAGQVATTGSGNTFIGAGSGGAVTTGNSNTILGRYSGNQGGLDIRSSNNWVVLSDGDGNPRGIFDNGGRFLAATVAPINAAHTFQIGTPVSDVIVAVNSNNASPYGIQARYTANDPNSTGYPYYEAYNALTTKLYFEVRSNGGVANYQANNVNLSDRREKTNFAPAGEYLSKICAIPVQTFNYIDQNMEDDPGLTLGVVAQDVQAVAPELVMESNWGDRDNPKMRLSVYQTDLQYALMKCIQELKADLDATKAELAALKGA